MWSRLGMVAHRWRWRLVRRGRLFRALTALSVGRTDAAEAELTHPGAVGDQQAELLSAILAVMVAPSLSSATRCVEALERAAADSDPEVIPVAAAALEPALRCNPARPLDFIERVVGLTERLLRLSGPLPWGTYNLAVHALRAGKFDTAAEHLASGPSTPVGGWPVPLLGAACAAVLGYSAVLSRWLLVPIDAPAFAADRQLLQGVHEVFECLRDDRPVEPDRLGALFGATPGPLSRTVPQLSALQVLLADAIRGTSSRVTSADLAGCGWGQWLGDRLQYASGEATTVLSAFAATEDQEPAVAWQRVVAQQDLLALLPGQTARRLRKRVLDLLPHPASGSVWDRIAKLRIDARPASGEQMAPGAYDEPCPWWPADSPLQTVAQCESEVEHHYLEARQALREDVLAEASSRFGRARARIVGEGFATRLVALRFGPLVDYWEGVTLAHLGEADRAANLLRGCANGVMAREARVQLGLLAVAGGDHTEARRLLATVPEPHPPSAAYLAAVLAAHDGDVPEATRVLGRLEERDAGTYHTAAHRLRGRLSETSGEVAEAAQSYRQALALRPNDLVAAARLARVWLRQRYDDAEVPPEPLLDDSWTALQSVESAALLPLLRHCLDGLSGASARELLDRVPADPALRLLALRCAVEAGEEAKALEAVSGWVGEDNKDLALAADVLGAARLVREFCLANGEGPHRVELAGLERRLRAEDGPVLAFWASAARAVMNPEALATTPPIPAIDDETRSPDVRAFAGLLSVFSADPEQRRAGAVRCRTELDSVTQRDERSRAVLRCLAADASGDDRGFVAAYGEIETELHALPLDTTTAYLAATEARLRVGDVDAIVDGFLPEPLADLAHPGVRRAMAVAYARRSVRSAHRDPRAALRDLDQARELLGEAP